MKLTDLVTELGEGDKPSLASFEASFEARTPAEQKLFDACRELADFVNKKRSSWTLLVHIRREKRQVAILAQRLADAAAECNASITWDEDGTMRIEAPEEES